MYQSWLIADYTLCSRVVPSMVGLLSFTGAFKWFRNAMSMAAVALGCRGSAFRLLRSQWQRISSDVVTDLTNRCHGWL